MSEKKIFGKPQSLLERPFHYCPGCGHGILHRLVAECMDELGIREKTIGVASVGCSVFSYWYFNCDMSQAAHGRAPAVATGIKRVYPDRFVFTYQGDGDLAAIGTAEIIHAANRGENITVFFVNNAVYGMTGGQMAPTTLIGQRTTTSPSGRDPKTMGYPIRMSEILSQVEGAKFVQRTSIHDPQNIIKTKKAVKRAIRCQLAGLGFSIVEVLSACPTNLGKTPVEAVGFVKDQLMPYYPLKVFKDELGPEVEND